MEWRCIKDYAQYDNLLGPGLRCGASLRDDASDEGEGGACAIQLA